MCSIFLCGWGFTTLLLVAMDFRLCGDGDFLGLGFGQGARLLAVCFVFALQLPLQWRSTGLPAW
jgi:hypothetical protein